MFVSLQTIELCKPTDGFDQVVTHRAGILIYSSIYVQTRGNRDLIGAVGLRSYYTTYKDSLCLLAGQILNVRYLAMY